jgi:hypothetical protein
MNENEALQDAFWGEFFERYSLVPFEPSEAPFKSRRIKYDRLPGLWLETIANFGMSTRTDDKNIAVSLIIEAKSKEYEEFELTELEKRAIAGEPDHHHEWSDKRVEGRRTIKLVKIVRDLRENRDDWEAHQSWLHNRLQALRQLVQSKCRTPV